MKFQEKILAKYLGETPIPLALERALEGNIYKGLPFPRPILDIGCGEGTFAKLVFAEKIETGIDPNPVELKRAKASGIYMELICCTGDSIPRSAQSYSTIFSNSVLEHIPDINPVLREVHRLLKPEGIFYMTVPSNLFEEFTFAYEILKKTNLDDIKRIYRKLFNRFWRHYHAYEQKKWMELAEKNGFVVKEVYAYNGKKLCLLNDFLAPFSVFSFLIKKITNQWSLFPRIRYIALYPLSLLLDRWLQRNKRLSQGGLIFMELRKK